MSMLTMREIIVLIEICIVLGACLGVPVVVVVHSSSTQVDRKLLVDKPPSSHSANNNRGSMSPAMSLDGLTETVSTSQLASESLAGSPAANNSGNSSQASTTTPPPSSTQDPNQHQDSDLDEPPLPPTTQDNSTNKAPDKDDPSGDSGKNPNNIGGNRGSNSTGDGADNPSATGSERVGIELGVLWYSVFMVYVSFIKLIYHNVGMIRRNLTEPGILMIFGIVWELISRQLNSSLDVAPRFNSRIFFYLFLPSTVLESASILSNKWLFLNLLPILVHSIVGTLLYGSAIAFTIHAMSKQDLFNIGTSAHLVGGSPAAAATTAQAALWRDQWLAQANVNSSGAATTSPSMTMMNDESEESIFLYEKGYVINAPMLDVGNLTLADCLVFGSIMSSLDSTTMLGAFSMYQVNEKLYYLVLGETLMNNAVVLIVFNLLLDFLNASRLTVVKIYIAIIQFFITLIGSIFVGLLVASVALLAVRLIKRFQVPSALTSYQNQCLAMIETLLILKLAYLTYTLGSLAGLSSIVSLATFGVLQDQYIRLNLNLRSQLTFRQVVLATKTMGFSLVYPLLGMLLVDVAYASQYVHQQPLTTSAAMSLAQAQELAATRGVVGGAAIQAAAATKLTSLATQAGSLLWNFKFLSLVTVISLAYRFGIVILLSVFCNLISSRKVKLRFRDQLLLAYGGLKGPLAVALVHRLIEHDDHRERLIMRNKHLFMYTILIMTLLSVVFKGALIRPLVEKMQVALHRSSASQKVVLFTAINTKVIERTTQAVSSLIGRSKSPYDRLFDFNEARIKPWLARDGSNTYWLSNLYDKLLLDESLDSSCFYKSAEESIAGSFGHSRARRGSGEPANRQRASRTGSFQNQLDTIDEHGGGFIDDDELHERNSHFGLSSSQRAPPNLQRLRQPKTRKTKNGDGQRGSNSMAPRDDRPEATAGLKEFVMLDLELATGHDDAVTGRRSNRVEPIEKTVASSNGKSVPITTQRMLSSSSGGTGESLRLRQRPQSSSDKEGYISQLERHLRASRRRAAGGSFTRNSKIKLPDLQGKSVSAKRKEPKLRHEKRHDKTKRDKHSRQSQGAKGAAATTRTIGPENDRGVPTSLSSD